MAAPGQQSLHLEHRTWTSLFSPSAFPLPWVGDSPSIEERRRYMVAYLNWMIPFPGEIEEVLDKEREVRHEARKKVVAGYIADGQTRLREGLFEYQVDNVYWKIWLSKMRPNAPMWRWKKPAEDPDDKWSPTFDTLTRDDEVKAMAQRWLDAHGQG